MSIVRGYPSKRRYWGIHETRRERKGNKAAANKRITRIRNDMDFHKELSCASTVIIANSTVQHWDCTRTESTAVAQKDHHETHLTPTIFVKVRDQIVKAVDHGLVLLLAVLDGLFAVDFPRFLAGSTEKILVAIDARFDSLSLEDGILVAQHVETGKDALERVAHGVSFEGTVHFEHEIHAEQEEASGAHWREGSVLDHCIGSSREGHVWFVGGSTAS